MNVCTFSIVKTGETIERTIDSNGSFIDRVIACKPTIEPTKLSPSETRIQQNRIDTIKIAHMNYRARIAQPIKRTKKQLQAIDYLLGDINRDSRTLQQRREDTEIENMNHKEFLSHLDNWKRKQQDTILRDKETIASIREWLYNPEYVKSVCGQCGKVYKGNCGNYCNDCLNTF